MFIKSNSWPHGKAVAKYCSINIFRAYSLSLRDLAQIEIRIHIKPNLNTQPDTKRTKIQSRHKLEESYLCFYINQNPSNNLTFLLEGARDCWDIKDNQWSNWSKKWERTQTWKNKANTNRTQTIPKKESLTGSPICENRRYNRWLKKQLYDTIHFEMGRNKPGNQCLK
jgi:hypothetical protein